MEFKKIQSQNFPKYQRCSPKLPPMSLLLLLLCMCISAAAAEAVTLPLPSTVSTVPTAYEILKSYNFPIGLLPVGATGYDFDPESGKFSVYFHGECSFSIQGSYQLRYQPTITGRISKNKLQDLKGISVKVLFLWLNIVEVDRNGDDLEFSVGIASADFAVSNFEECPQCGCGMDCGNRKADEENSGSRVNLRSSF